MESVNSIGIVGCGLLGGSFALAMRRAGFTGRIAGYGGSNGPTLALERGIIDAVVGPEEIARTSELLFLAAPIGGIIDFLKKYGREVSKGSLVTDAGSTKAEICRTAAENLNPDACFIGGHPMAGSEQNGVVYSRGDLFDGASWALIESELRDTHNSRRMELIVEATGARPSWYTAENHDSSVALISHLPQLIASALAAVLAESGTDSARELAASGWRDMTRLGGSSWAMWRDIVMTNPENISTVLNTLIEKLGGLRDSLETRSYGEIRELFLLGNKSVEEQRQLRLRGFKKG